jgi:hypothetical protein
MHLKSSDARVGDSFYKIINGTEFMLITITSIKPKTVKAEDLIGIYTHSKTLIANNLLGSSISDRDYNEIWHPIAKTVSDLGGHKIPHLVGDFMGAQLDGILGDVIWVKEESISIGREESAGID